MKAKSLVLAGAVLLMTTLPASAQLFGRGRATRSAGTYSSYTAPYPYGTGYSNSGYNQFGTTNSYGYNQFGPTSAYGYNTRGVSPYMTPVQNSSFYTPNGMMPGTVVQATGTASTSGRMGLKITELASDGPAKDAGLDTGDVILSVDGKMTQNFDDLRSALKATDKKEVKVEFWDASAGKTDTKKVMVKDTKIGVTIEETMVKQ